MKKLLSLILAATIMFSTIGFAFAAQNTKETQKDFSADTVITKDNANEILKHYGIDPTKIDKSKDVSTLPQITVGDLEKALEEAKNTPKTIVDRDDAVTEEANNDISAADTKKTNNDVSAAATGTATVHKDVKYTDTLTVNYTVSGYYYKSTTVKWWTGALGSSIATTSSGPTYYWKITSVTKNTNKCVKSQHN